MYVNVCENCGAFSYTAAERSNDPYCECGGKRKPFLQEANCSGQPSRGNGRQLDGIAFYDEMPEDDYAAGDLPRWFQRILWMIPAGLITMLLLQTIRLLFF